jgi:hypothetical protein
VSKELEKQFKEGEVQKVEERTVPEVFDTTGPKLRAHFENYEEGPQFENGEPSFDDIREEIAVYYGVPCDEAHLFIIDNKMLDRMRHYRAFCVLRRKIGGSQDAWYIDGRLPHAAMLRRLYNYYGVPDDDRNEIVLGFLDDEGFPDVKEIQEKVAKENKDIRWFVREVVSPSIVDTIETIE